MSKKVNRNHAMAQRAYRLHLLEGISREISFRSCAYPEEPWCKGQPVPTVADMLYLKETLPMLDYEDQANCLTAQIAQALASCQSDLVRSIPPGNIAYFMRQAYQQTARTCLPEEQPVA